ncbi:7094_t:CDS:2 [Gigaspora margarita]|uniref:7094_t:CDS:1 n=1 Tax=Gigaspora margarita TaxID=4874 RepID=A0ABN7VDA3_GIGMA|nr:7094_t:CDS:2 [Gigaspora margarita]
MHPQNRKVEVNIPTFDPTGDLHAQIIMAYITMQQMQRQGRREEALGYAFFIGQLIETVTTTSAQRTACRNLLTKYYATVVERAYYIFKQ